MTAILGISAFYHDAAAALIVDGEIVAAAQEERFTRKKHDAEFPTNAIAYCLREAGLKPEQLDYVGFYDKPLLKFERILETYLRYAPRGFRSFTKAMPVWLRKKLYIKAQIAKGLGGAYTKRIVFPEHHVSHAASAFFPSPYQEAAVMTMDGVGEWATSSFGVGRDNTVTLTHEQHFPHSLGLLYSAFTYYTGFRVNSGEYKLMGLAPYGEPKYVDRIVEELLDIKPDGSFRMDQSYFNYCQGLTMTGPRFHALFDGPPRPAESKISQKEMDVAASIQVVTDRIVMDSAKHVHEVTGMKHLCLAGGVALNCVSNGKLLRDGPYDSIWIQPAAGDAGGALGVAQLIWYQLLDNPRTAQSEDSQSGSLLGPRYGTDAVLEFLSGTDAVFHHLDSEEEVVERTAQLIAEENVIGWYQGRMEFGPRALGSRSILGDPRSTDMQQVMNLKIKFRESFRPFAPAVLQDHVHECFLFREKEPSPYMLLVAPVVEERCKEVDPNITGLAKLKLERSDLPAITHVDYSARVQTVNAERNGRYYKLIKRFHEKTGCPVVVNTSFNVRGEPIVCSPAHAYRCFMATNMDVLVMEDVMLIKSEQPNAGEHDREEYLTQFELD